MVAKIKSRIVNFFCDHLVGTFLRPIGWEKLELNFKNYLRPFGRYFFATNWSGKFGTRFCDQMVAKIFSDHLVAKFLRPTCNETVADGWRPNFTIKIHFVAKLRRNSSQIIFSEDLFSDRILRPNFVSKFGIRTTISFFATNYFGRKISFFL